MSDRALKSEDRHKRGGCHGQATSARAASPHSLAGTGRAQRAPPLASAARRKDNAAPLLAQRGRVSRNRRAISDRSFVHRLAVWSRRVLAWCWRARQRAQRGGEQTRAAPRPWVASNRTAHGLRRVLLSARVSPRCDEGCERARVLVACGERRTIPDTHLLDDAPGGQASGTERLSGGKAGRALESNERAWGVCSAERSGGWRAGRHAEFRADNSVGRPRRRVSHRKLPNSAEGRPGGQNAVPPAAAAGGGKISQCRRLPDRRAEQAAERLDPRQPTIRSQPQALQDRRSVGRGCSHSRPLIRSTPQKNAHRTYRATR